VEDGRDVVGVRQPARLRVGQLRLVAGLGGRDDVGRDQDVLAQELRHLVTRRLAVERLHGVADVVLVLEQPRDGGLGVGRAAFEADDREPRPGDVVLPQLAHVDAERDGLLRQRRRVTRHPVGSSLIQSP